MAGRWLMYSTSLRFFALEKKAKELVFFGKEKTIRQLPNAMLNGNKILLIIYEKSYIREIYN
jgi:capsule polysaccharide modification protein KpsS